MIWAVIALVLVVAVGPLLWLMPSARQRQLAALRAAARGTGLVVEVASVPKLDASPYERVSAGGVLKEVNAACVAYRLPLPEQLAPAPPRWLLVKTAAAGEAAPHAGSASPLAGWALRAPARDAPEMAEYWQRVGAVVDELPGGCLAVEVEARQVSWYGVERLDGLAPAAVVDGIRRGLGALAALHGAGG